MRKRTFAILLYIAVLLCVHPLQAYAEENHQHQYSAVVTDPTCTEQGYTSYTCECGDSYVSDYSDAAGHDYVDHVCCVCGVSEYRATGECGENLTWTLTYDGLLTVSGEGAMQNSGAFSLWYKYKAYITTALIEEGATTIGSYSFSGLTNLTRVTIPGSVETIRTGAFDNCSALTELNIAPGVTTIEKYAFSLTGLVNVILPETVTTLGERAFSNCYSLEYVYIPANLTDIGKMAFFRANALTGFEVSPDNPVCTTDSYGVLFSKDGTLLIQAPGALSGVYTIPEGTETVGTYAFYECQYLTGIEFPESPVSLESWALAYCHGFTEFTVPASVTELPNNLFSGCKNLKSVIVSEGITAIGASCFSDCKKLSEISLPDSLESIGSNAFNCCYALTEITIPDNVSVLNSQIFYYCWDLKTIYLGSGITNIQSAIFGDCETTTTIVFTGDAPTIDSCAFQNLTVYLYYPIDNDTWTLSVRLTYGGNTYWYSYYPIVASGACGPNLEWELNTNGELTISGSGAMEDYTNYESVPWYSYKSQIRYLIVESGVTSLGDYAFFWCTNMTWLSLPNSLTRIGSYAFDYCTGLTSIKIPTNVTQIDTCAFIGCSNLKSVTIPSSTKTIGDSAFKACYALASVTMPEGLTVIGKEAFSLCNSLTTVTIPATVTQIGSMAFHNCKNLEQIIVQENNTVYASDETGVLFSKDYSTLIQAPGALSGEYSIPDTVRTIESGAFSYCTKLTGIRIPTGVAAIEDIAFYNCTGLIQVIVPDSVTAMGNSVFANCYHLQTAVLPASIGTIPDGTFIECASMTQFSVPEGITAICKQAFMSCTSLTDITIPQSVTTIDRYAFYECDILENVWFPGTEAQWNSISIGNENEALTKASVHCNTALAPSVQIQPAGQTVTAGSTAVFSVGAYGTNITYQWQYRTSSQGKWIKCTASGNRSAIMYVAATCAKDGYEYRCKITDSNGKSIYTDVVSLYVLGITAQPAGQKVIAGNDAVFRVSATGQELQYQWYFRSSSGSWTKSPAAGNKTAALTIPGTTGRSGLQYYCVITDAAGNTVSTNPVYLYVLGIKTQPTTQYVAAGDKAIFTVSASGHLKTYQWQYRTGSDDTWKSATASGNKTASLSVPGTTGRNGYQYRCRITDSVGNVIYTDTVTLYVLGIKTQPTSKTVSAGTIAKFSVTATGANLTYQWQYRTSDTGTWKSATAAGNQTANLTVPGTIGRNGYQYRCKITDALGNVIYSDVVTLTVN